MTELSHNAIDMLSRQGRRRFPAGHRGWPPPAAWLVAAVFIVAALVLSACSGDGLNFSVTVEPGRVTCQPFMLFKGYQYRSGAQIDIAERPPDAPPEDPDRGTAGFHLTIEIPGSIQNPDRVQAVVTYPDSGYEDVSMVAIGSQAWTLLADTWEPATIDPARPFPIPYLPPNICNSIAPDINVSGMTGTPEEVGGLPAQKYHFEDLPANFASNLPEWGAQSDPGRFIKKFDVDVWIAEEGNYILKLDTAGASTYENGRAISLKVFMEIWDVNKDIKVEPPVGS